MIEILLVDDSEFDCRLTIEAPKDAKLCNKIHVVHDGEKALEFLRRPGERRPDLVLLDLNLPGLDGREVLEEIKADPLLKHVILTTSRAEADILRSYQSHASCYVSKPVDLEQFSKVVQSIESFWFSVVSLVPPGEAV